jgi:uncharacterized protein
VLEGVVTNIVAFGAFVDVGVHQDGLVHVSQLSDRYVADPNAAVRVGQKVRVTVMAIDLERNRIALSMKSKPELPGAGPSSGVRAERPERSERADRGERGDRGRAARPGSRPDARPETRTPSFVPRSGAVAPNGIRFK